MGMEDCVSHAYWDVGGDNVSKMLVNNNFNMAIGQFFEQLLHIFPVLWGDGLSK